VAPACLLVQVPWMFHVKKDRPIGWSYTVNPRKGRLQGSVSVSVGSGKIDPFVPTSICCFM
jgi:hypothetical protein